jgi:peptidyl-dipeptidase Dcp
LNYITNDEDLSGLPEGTIEAARSLAKAKKKRLDLHARLPSYVPFVTYADNESYARRWLLLLAQRFQNNELDNQQNVFKIAKLRFDRANFRIRYSCPLCA